MDDRDEKIIRVIMASPEMSRTDKIVVTISYSALVAYILLGMSSRKRRG